MMHYRAAGHRPPEVAWPRLDVYRGDSSYHMVVEVPGVDEQELGVFIEPGSLVIEGQYPETAEFGEPLCRERSTGRFVRTVRIPDDILPEEVSARYDRGLLTIDLPTAEEAEDNRRVRITPARRRLRDQDTGES